MVRWLRWHCPPDTRALAVWGRARYISVTEAPHNTDFHTWMGKKDLCFIQTAETGNRTPNSAVLTTTLEPPPRKSVETIYRYCGLYVLRSMVTYNNFRSPICPRYDTCERMKKFIFLRNINRFILIKPVFFLSPWSYFFKKLRKFISIHFVTRWWSNPFNWT